MKSNHMLRKIQEMQVSKVEYHIQFSSFRNLAHLLTLISSVAMLELVVTELI